MKTDDKNSRLHYLDELDDYKVADSDKDVRGWTVRDTNGKVIGEVDDLIVNKSTEKVVYLDVYVDESIISANTPSYIKKEGDGMNDFINDGDDKHIIIPIGMATLDLENEIVFTHTIDYDTYVQTRRYRKGDPLYREYEEEVYNTYTRPELDTVYPDDDSFYEHEDFNW